MSKGPPLGQEVGCVLPPPGALTGLLQGWGEGGQLDLGPRMPWFPVPCGGPTHLLLSGPIQSLSFPLGLEVRLVPSCWPEANVAVTDLVSGCIRNRGQVVLGSSCMGRSALRTRDSLGAPSLGEPGPWGGGGRQGLLLEEVGI